MSYTPSSPLTGAAQTGLTSPTYTLSADIAPSQNAIQHAVTALGGTQTGVDTHSVSNPFTITMFRPVSFKALPAVNNQGYLPNVPKNVFKLITRKGVTPLTGQPESIMIITTEISVPAGADIADANSILAALSAHVGALSNQSAGIGQSTITGVL